MNTEDDILKQIYSEHVVPFTRDDSEERIRSRERLYVYGLIYEHPRHQWRLTEKGYEAVDIGFDKWLRKKEQKGLISLLKKIWLYFLIPIIIGLILLVIEQAWF